MIENGHRETRGTRRLIRSFQAKALKKRPFVVRVADWATSYFGTIEFFAINASVFAFWIVLNTGVIPGIRPFDPFPFILLTMTVSLEAIFLTIIVLMSQNRQAYIATLRDELELQVNLITERELTKALQLLANLHRFHNIPLDDPELDAMVKATNVSYIERKLEEEISDRPKSLPQVVTKPFTAISHSFQHAQKQSGLAAGAKNGEKRKPLQ
ncbi:DUF1003 domain-containing protein [Candidatus Gottesmanbacteria bacterium]|nr:DUF1003 domain-containing protein [Candidatus Gottesmanbacteria bacterium]